MAKNDWNPDDLLDFHYDHPVADRNKELDEFDRLIESHRQKAAENSMPAAKDNARRGLDDSFDSYDEYKRYEEIRSRENTGGRSFHASGSGTQGRGSTNAAAGSAGMPKSGTVNAAASAAGANGASASADKEIRIPKYEAPSYEIEPPISQQHAEHQAHAAHADHAPQTGSADQRAHHISAAASGSAAGQAHAQQKDSDDLLEELFGEPASPQRDEDIFREFDSLLSEDRGMPQEAPEDPHALNASKDIDAIKQASKDAFDRYRSNYTKTKKKKAGRAPVTKFHKWLTGIYGVALAAFLGSMAYMDVLPFGMLVALCVILGLLTMVILVQTRRSSIKKWGRRFATLLAMVLIVFYGVGTAYALGTLSFLSSTSVENENAVANITRDPFNVVITGIDVRGTIDEEGRSDVNMVLTVNPKTAQVLMTSIPRDYEIYMPDKDNAMDKLTHTGFYGVPTTILAEEDLLDFKANYYVKVNFTTVEKFIDAIGGVDVYSEYEFVPVKMKDWTVKEGMNHMNGAQALAFARERKAFVTGDNQRIKNQQAVFEAMFRKATSSRTMVFRYNKILSNLKDYFEMSVSSRETRSLAKMQLAKNPEWHIYRNTVVGGDGLLPTYTAGGEYSYVMTQDADSIGNAVTLMNAVMEGRELAKDEDDNVYVVEGSGEESGEEASEEE